MRDGLKDPGVVVVIAFAVAFGLLGISLLIRLDAKEGPPGLPFFFLGFLLALFHKPIGSAAFRAFTKPGVWGQTVWRAVGERSTQYLYLVIAPSWSSWA
jgi:hypothetical protein